METPTKFELITGPHYAGDLHCIVKYHWGK